MRTLTIALLSICLHFQLYSFEKLRVYDDSSHQLLLRTSDARLVNTLLNENGIVFERWKTGFDLSNDSDQEAILKAYQTDVQRLMDDQGYQAVDVLKMLPDSPKKVELRKKFQQEHTHTEDEVRFFAEGSALFYLHLNNQVFLVLCEEGDLISIPAYTPHWFDMGPQPYFTAIRFFNDSKGWIANFTDSSISQHYPRYEYLN